MQFKYAPPSGAITAQSLHILIRMLNTLPCRTSCAPCAVASATQLTMKQPDKISPKHGHLHHPWVADLPQREKCVFVQRADCQAVVFRACVPTCLPPCAPYAEGVVPCCRQCLSALPLPVCDTSSGGQPLGRSACMACAVSRIPSLAGGVRCVDELPMVRSMRWKRDGARCG